MSHNAAAFINESGTVVQVISGALTQAQADSFLPTYSKLFGATQAILVEEGVPVWIGGSYTDGVFTPPPAPEPLPEPLPEPQPEPEI